MALPPDTTSDRNSSRPAQAVSNVPPPHPALLLGNLGRFVSIAREADSAEKTGRGVWCRRRTTSQTTPPESVRAGRDPVDAYYVNPIPLNGSDYGGHTPEGVEKKIVAGEDIVADIKRICRLR